MQQVLHETRKSEHPSEALFIRSFEVQEMRSEVQEVCSVTIAHAEPRFDETSLSNLPPDVLPHHFLAVAHDGIP